MAIAGSFFTLIDQSQVNSVTVPTEDSSNRPIFLCAFSSDKGPEEFQTSCFGQTFFDLYGTTPDFSKHGQPLIQAADSISAGARLFCKRIVADDSTLANIGIVAQVSHTSVQAVDSQNRPLYTDANGNQTTDSQTNGVNNTPLMVEKANIKFVLKTLALAGNDIKSFANQFYADNKHTDSATPNIDNQYALFMFFDTGRGISNKRFRIYTSTVNSYPANYIRYTLEISENGTILESIPFTMNPSIPPINKNISLNNMVKTSSNQFRCIFFDDEFDAFTEDVATTIGDTDNNFAYADVLFGTDLYGKTYTNINYDQTVNFSTINGIPLQNGTNGSFGNRPISSSTYNAQLITCFDGTYDEIYDLDNNKIMACFDANYPDTVKRAIESLANFREDFMYFRDMGTGISSLAEVISLDNLNTKSKFCATYLNSWDIYDPWTLKQITVTSTYNLARKFVNHYLNGPSRPFCGEKYSIVFNDSNDANAVIDGTINFNPKITPSLNQKQILDDARINYATYNNGILSMVSEYTSQTEYTQLSWISNVIAIQELIRGIRSNCPKIRYQFITGTDFTKYQQDVQDIINNYSSSFKTCTMTYLKDINYENNKIFYASISVTFENFVQTEYFKIIALQTTD